MWFGLVARWNVHIFAEEVTMPLTSYKSYNLLNSKKAVIDPILCVGWFSDIYGGNQQVFREAFAELIIQCDWSIKLGGFFNPVKSENFNYPPNINIHSHHRLIHSRYNVFRLTLCLMTVTGQIQRFESLAHRIQVCIVFCETHGIVVLARGSIPQMYPVITILHVLSELELNAIPICW